MPLERPFMTSIIYFLVSMNRLIKVNERSRSLRASQLVAELVDITI